MKAILVLFDSLQRGFLPPYGNDWVQAPNFARLAARALTFDRCFVGSMPCMPARRELHTGRYNFLHRSWGPLEPFDDSMPRMLKTGGVYSHLCSDHGHYWEEGGCTYHTQYSSWEIARGQEGDPWKAQLADPEVPLHLGHGMRQDWINRKHWAREEDMSQTKVFDQACEFLDTNHAADRWFLQVECFDPHPPFFAPQKYRDLYPSDYRGPQFDFPRYARVSEEEREAVDECRRNYAALVSLCDHSLGRILDAMDRHGLWEDTLLVVTTDHGFMLGEHGWWAFVNQPFYNTCALKPMLLWDPRDSRPGERTGQVAQMHDVPVTLLEYFNLPRGKDMQGIDLGAALRGQGEAREGILFGVFGGQVNVTDGRYVYMRAPLAEDGQPLFNYTLMPTHMHRFFSPQELGAAQLAPPFAFTKNYPVLRCPARPFFRSQHEFGNLLFDLATDPEQEHPIDDPAVEARMIQLMVAGMQANDAPAEQYERLGLPIP
ncbi:MAG: sulfatase [Lentisphaeria bacterium]|jgi:arylsulfatase A-like enzyme|nr:sulfatase [Lentisphaeria bacterium]